MTPRTHWLPLAYIVIALPVMVFLAVMIPPGETPDEVAHIIRADGLRHGALFGQLSPTPVQDNDRPIIALGAFDNFGLCQSKTGQFSGPQPGVFANFALVKAADLFTCSWGSPKRLTDERLEQHRAIPWDDKLSFLKIPNTAAYMPLFYAPGALGLGLASLVGLTPYDAIRAGRILNALAYVLIGTTALRAATREPWLVLATLTLPMSLWLGASFNQDGLLIASAALVAAILMHPSGAGRFWAASALLGIIIAAKPPYFPLAGLLLITAQPPSFTSMRPKIGGFFVALLPSILWMSLTTGIAQDFTLGAPYHPGPLWPGAPSVTFATRDRVEQMHVLLHAPQLMVTLPLQAIRDHGMETIRQMIGALGLFDIAIPEWIVRIWFVALTTVIGAGLLLRPAMPRLTFTLACLIACVFAVYLSQYITWTEVGAARIEGMQGRYLLPILPFALAFSRRPISQTMLGSAGATVTVFAATVSLFSVPALALMTYYFPTP